MEWLIGYLIFHLVCATVDFYIVIQIFDLLVERPVNGYHMLVGLTTAVVLSLFGGPFLLMALIKSRGRKDIVKCLKK